MLLPDDIYSKLRQEVGNIQNKYDGPLRDGEKSTGYPGWVFYDFLVATLFCDRDR